MIGFRIDPNFQVKSSFMVSNHDHVFNTSLFMCSIHVHAVSMMCPPLHIAVSAHISLCTIDVASVSFHGSLCILAVSRHHIHKIVHPPASSRNAHTACIHHQNKQPCGCKNEHYRFLTRTLFCHVNLYTI